MNNTVKETSEFVYKNNKLDKTREIIENTLHEYEQKYGEKYRRIIKVICVVDFLDKVENESKNFFLRVITLSENWTG